MRIIVSGTHASGKSTLISDFRAVRPGYVLLPDPFEELDLDDPASERSFATQLRFSATRLQESTGIRVIAERGPLDFLAYLTALERLGRSDGDLLPRATAITLQSMEPGDLIAVVPLDDRHPIRVPADEDPELRDETDAALLDLVDDLRDLLPSLVLLTGDPQQRLATLMKQAECSSP